MKKTKIKPDLQPHHVHPFAWYYREAKHFDIYVHAAPGNIINFRIPYHMVPRRQPRRLKKHGQ